MTWQEIENDVLAGLTLVAFGLQGVIWMLIQ